MNEKKIVLLATASETTNIVFNGLGLEIDKVIIEARQSERELLTRRLKKLGARTVFGQILFRLVIVPVIHFRSQSRLEEIRNQFRFDPSPIDARKIIRVRSVNDDETRVLLKELDPEVILIKGTRIIANKTLEDVSAKFVNMHTGITPRYRGVYGAYWALAERNPALCGVTIHLVDAGIDTGQILAQAPILATNSDNILTYPYLQMAVGLPLLHDCIHQLINHKSVSTMPSESISKIWTHPTIWQYLTYRMCAGVK